MSDSQRWLLFSYTVPKNPSTVRVNLWRRLRNIGALYIAQSVCLFPDVIDAAAKLEACKQVALDSGGSAHLIPMVVSNEASERSLVMEFTALRSAEYAELRERAQALLDELRREGEKGKFNFAELEENEDELEKLERWLKRIEARDVLECSDHGPSVGILSDCRAALAEFRNATLRHEVDPDLPDNGR